MGGKLLVRVINYVNSVSDILSKGIINMILEIINLIFIVVFMYATNATLATMIVAGLPVFIAIIVLIKPRQRRAWQNQSNKNSNYNAYLERIFETMDEPVTVDDAPDAEALPPISGEVDFEDVTFAYEEGVNVLEHMNLHIRAGESIALVGPTGAGKSTVINLLCRFYNLNGGRILLHDRQGGTHDISRATLHSLRSQLGIMLQDSFIFSGKPRSVRRPRMTAASVRPEAPPGIAKKLSKFFQKRLTAKNIFDKI